MRAVRGPLLGMMIGSLSMPRASLGLSVMMKTRAPLAFTFKSIFWSIHERMKCYRRFRIWQDVYCV